MKKQNKDMKAVLKEADQFLKKMELMYYTTYKQKRTRHYMEGKSIFGDSKDVKDVHGLHFIITKDNLSDYYKNDTFVGKDTNPFFEEVPFLCNSIDEIDFENL